MNELASVLILAWALSASPEGSAQPPTGTAVPQVRMTQFQPFPMGRVCITRFGSCPIAPRPINTQCFCGNVPGTAR